MAFVSKMEYKLERFDQSSESYGPCTLDIAFENQTGINISVGNDKINIPHDMIYTFASIIDQFLRHATPIHCLDVERARKF